MNEENRPEELPREQPQPEITPEAPKPLASPLYGHTYAPASEPSYFTTGRRELRYAVFLLLACLMAVDGFLWTATGLLASAACVALALIGGCYLLRGGRRWSCYGIFCYTAYIACALTFVLTDSGAADFPMVLLMVLLAAVAMLERTGLRQYTDGSFRSIADLCYMVFALTFGKIGQAFYTLFHRDGGEKRRIGSVLLGILIAVPVLFVILPLLISSDVAFAAMLERWLAIDRFSELVGVLILGFFLFVLLFGRLISLPRVKRSAPPASLCGGLEPTVVISFLAVISAVYALYLFSQLAYFFNAFSGLLPKEFTVAEYARRGFFEMTLISALNLGLIFLAHLVCRKKDGRTPLAVRLLSLFLCVFSQILSVTVLSKLRLYIASFGMTKLRILTSVFTVFLMIVFLAVALRLFFRRVPYMKIAFAAAAVLTLVSAYADTDRVIAHYNVDAYLTGKLDTIDMESLKWLHSDAIVEDVLRLVDVPDAEVAQQAKELLTDHANRLFVLRETADGGTYTAYGDWRSWNTVESNARELLTAHYDEYYQNEAE